MRVGSLFTGYGGLDMAVGGDVVWYSEIEPAACKILAEHYPGVPNLGDITVVDWSTVEPVDVITGGYPCQPFSTAGMRRGKNDERHLWPYVRNAISTLRPSFAVLENVRGHLSMGLADVIGDLAGVGYDARWGLVRASDAGAPHGRARVFIVAYPAGTGSGCDLQQGGLSLQSGRSVGTVADTNGERYGGRERSSGLGRVGSTTDSSRREASTTWKESRAGSNQDAADTDCKGSQGFSDRSSKAQARSNRHTEQSISPSIPNKDSQSDGDTNSVNVAPKQAGDQQGSESTRDCSDGREGLTDWGTYSPAVRRWESITRPAPQPTIYRADRERLNPRFVEWMMGLPDGHVTERGLSAAQELKMLGNGVCPQQAALALRLLGVA